MDPQNMTPEARMAAYRVEARLLAERYGVVFRELAAVNPNPDGRWPSIPEFRLAMAQVFEDHRRAHPAEGETASYTVDVESRPELPRTELEYLLRRAQADGQHVLRLRPGMRPPRALRPARGPRRRPDAGTRRRAR
jgi:hypothetical protein